MNQLEETRKRENHIRIEKKRRERIAKALDQLKLLVPKSRSNHRLYQLDILENAIEHIEELHRIVNQTPYIPPTIPDTITSPVERKRKRSWQMDILHLVDVNKPF
jgi:hypothetical protein